MTEEEFDIHQSMWGCDERHVSISLDDEDEDRASLTLKRVDDNEGFRRIGVEGWTSDYVWSRERGDWVLKGVDA